MYVWRVVLISSLIGLVLLGGAGCENGGNPTSPEALDNFTKQEGGTHPSDDISPSDIVTSPYKAYKLVAIGDSITAGICASPETRGYPGLLQSQLRTTGYTATVYNVGVPGATSEELKPYITAYVQGMDIALIMVGTNDISSDSDCADPQDPTTCQTLANIRFLIDEALQADVVPVLAAVTPKRPTDSLAEYNPAIQELNRQLAAIAAEYQIAFVDTYAVIMDNGDDSLFCDKHHFTDQGYTVIAEAFHKTLTTQIFYQKF